MAWRCVRRGVVRGPLTAEQIKQLFASEKITEETLVSHPEHTRGKWRRLVATELHQRFCDAPESQRDSPSSASH